MNEKLSKLYLYLFKVNSLIALAVIFSYWFGELDDYPSQFIMETTGLGFKTTVEEHSLFFPYIDKLLSWIISSTLYMIPFAFIGAYLGDLSERYKYESWDAMREANKRKYKESFKDCGKVVDIDLDEGGFLTNRYVSIKTESKIYRCLGSVSEVKIGSKVRKQYGDLLVVDGGKEKRLQLV